MSGKISAKSILKQPARKASTVTDEQKAQVEKDRKNLQLALKHAYLIQHQKDVQAAILDSIVTLIDLPAASRFTSQEAVTFVKLIKAFQPSDYDSLIEERGADGKCGYTLCENPPRSKIIGESSIWKLKQGMADWCSDECAKKGLYVKTQLSEVPAWERTAEQQPDIQLHEDDQPTGNDSALRRAKRAARVDEWRKKVANNDELALERGEKATSVRPNQVMSDVIVEKRPQAMKRKPIEPRIEHHDLIEGHHPRPIGRTTTLEHDSDDDEDDDT